MKFDRLQDMIAQALMAEVETTPKPGLVDRLDNGAHEDMDIETFAASTEAITPYLAEMFFVAYQGMQGMASDKLLSDDSRDDASSSGNFLNHPVHPERSDNPDGHDHVARPDYPDHVDDSSNAAHLNAADDINPAAHHDDADDINPAAHPNDAGDINPADCRDPANNINPANRPDDADDYNPADVPDYTVSHFSPVETSFPTLTSSDSWRLAFSGQIPEGDYTKEELIFLRIREIGKRAEQAMYLATGGINTHKGMIFNMGVLLAAAGCYFRQRDNEDPAVSDDILETVSIINKILMLTPRLCGRILRDELDRMREREPVTHGERLFHKFGETGVRGQAMEGFPILRDVSVPAMAKYLEPAPEILRAVKDNAAFLQSLSLYREPWKSPVYLNAVYINVLLSIASVLDDTNVLFRSSHAGMELLKEDCRYALSLGGAFTARGMEAVEELNLDLIWRNISPGGSADCLAVTILLWELVNEFKRGSANEFSGVPDEPDCPESVSLCQNLEQPKPTLIDEPVCPAGGSLCQNSERQ